MYNRKPPQSIFGVVVKHNTYSHLVTPSIKSNSHKPLVKSIFGLFLDAFGNLKKNKYYYRLVLYLKFKPLFN